MNVNPAMRDVIARVKSAGLHEAIRRENKLERFSIKEAAQMLGEQLLKNEAKYAAVRSGLRSLEAVRSELGPTKTASTERCLMSELLKSASMFDLRTLKNMMPEAGPAAGAAQSMPELATAARGAEHAGLFSQMDDAAAAGGKGFDPKKTIRGEQVPQELPPMQMLPKIPAANIG